MNEANFRPTNVKRGCWCLAQATLASALLLAGCGDDAQKAPQVEVEKGPFCLLGTLPFLLGDTGWRLEQNQEQSDVRPRIKHQPADILSNGEEYAYTDVPGATPMSSGNYIVRGVMARTKESQGLNAFPVNGELATVWSQNSIDGAWAKDGEQLTLDSEADAPGQYAIDLGTSSIEGESRFAYAILNAEQSCGAHAIYELSQGRQVVLADIDATMTLADDEIFRQIPDESYDQVEKPFSVELTQAWAAKGYQIVYLTARPHFFRAETRAWLTLHGYADGPMITAPELTLGDASRGYKREWVSRIKDDLGWDIVAAYGNSESDIGAYEEAGIDKAITFIIGENAGTSGTVAIENDSYATHIESYVQAQPDANAP
tara:strand:- start:50149 stop:51267 length:1119 start_codon:yes stop_codon:yes gene_type:complete